MYICAATTVFAAITAKRWWPTCPRGGARARARAEVSCVDICPQRVSGPAEIAIEGGGEEIGLGSKCFSGNRTGRVRHRT